LDIDGTYRVPPRPVDVKAKALLRHEKNEETLLQYGKNDGLRNAQKRRWHHDNKELDNARSRKWNDINAEHHAKLSKKWREENPDYHGNYYRKKLISRNNEQSK